MLFYYWSTSRNEKCVSIKVAGVLWGRHITYGEDIYVGYKYRNQYLNQVGYILHIIPNQKSILVTHEVALTLQSYRNL